MRVEIRIDGFEGGRELQHLARCCAGYELGPFRQRIERVRVRLSEAPARTHRREIGCAVEVEFYDRDSVAVTAADSNPYVAIHWALERAGGAISRQLEAARRGEHADDGAIGTGIPAAGGGVADRAA